MFYFILQINILYNYLDIESNNLIEASKILGVKFLDHIIITKNNYYSFVENNDICF